MNFTKNHTQLTDEDLDTNKEKDTLPYFVNGVRYQIINGQPVEIKPESNFDRFERHMIPLRKAQLKCNAKENSKTGNVKLIEYKQGDLFKWN